ncbi:MAG: alpha-L-arabinofuranosidase, partial [Bacteroidales bacterium]|nr:alpha-L-arabinofuranosidase [Bacteroidales bacterium]
LNCGAMRYDSYDRKGPKVFAGEYACHGRGKKWNHFETSLYEAAFMTGFERNADIVHMCTYAPLFAHVKGWQWRPDMIWYDNQNMFKTVSYYVQQLYGHYKGDNVLSCSMDKKPIAGQDGQDGLFATACYDNTLNAVILKVANVSDAEQEVKLTWTGKAKDLKAGFKSAEQITLRAVGMDDENSLDDPLKITPKTEVIAADATEIKVPAKAFQVYIFKK